MKIGTRHAAASLKLTNTFIPMRNNLIYYLLKLCELIDVNTVGNY